TDINVMICPSDSTGAQAIDSSTGFWYNQVELAAGNTGVVDPCAFTAESYMYVAWAMNGRPGADYLNPNYEANSDAVPSDPDIAWVTGNTFISGGFVGLIVAMLVAQDAVTPPDSANLYDDDQKFTNGLAVEKTLYRTREGIERFFITDINNPAGSTEAQSTIPIIWDLASTKAAEFNHIPGGSNVLYLDGHVSFVRFPSDFPITRAFSAMVSAF
ncbi:MAG: hypothetical protein GY851_24910, partial [bacterium]|nr:hypothetical protein [bacterium]